LRRIATLSTALAVMFALVATAVAQAPVDLQITTAKLTPNSAGTAKKPRNGSALVEFTVNRESNVTADQIVFNLPQKMKLSGKGFKYCPASKINAEGTKACPDGSKVGSGLATAYAGSTRIDYTITIYAGSVNEIAMNLAGNVSVPALRGIISSAGAPYGQKITVDIPQQVQQPIGGLYSAITYVKAQLGPATGKPSYVYKRIRGKRTRVKVPHYFLGTTGCETDKTHDFGVRLHFVPNPNPPQSADAEKKTTGPC
jgi:hypothetical protein